MVTILNRVFRGYCIKISFSPTSSFARKIRIAAIELCLIDRIEFAPEMVVLSNGMKSILALSPEEAAGPDSGQW